MVRTVPECLKKNKYHFDELKLKLNVKNLLNELLQNIISYGCYESTNIPPTIHNAIAMEACHGIFFYYFCIFIILQLILQKKKNYTIWKIMIGLNISQ